MDGRLSKGVIWKITCFISYVTKSNGLLKKTRSKVKLVHSIFEVITGLLHHFFFISNGVFVHEAFCMMLILNQTLWGKNILHDVLIERDQNIPIPLRVGNKSSWPWIKRQMQLHQKKKKKNIKLPIGESELNCPEQTMVNGFIAFFFFFIPCTYWWVSARLFPHFEPKKRFLKKVRPKIAFG